MSKTSMSIRLDSEVKEQAQQVFSNLGMDMTTAINIFLRQAIQYQGLPFDQPLPKIELHPEKSNHTLYTPFAVSSIDYV